MVDGTTVSLAGRKIGTNVSLATPGTEVPRRGIGVPPVPGWKRIGRIGPSPVTL